MIIVIRSVFIVMSFSMRPVEIMIFFNRRMRPSYELSRVTASIILINQHEMSGRG